MSQSENSAIKRRRVLASAGALSAFGALAASVQSLPGRRRSEDSLSIAKTETAGGYQLTEHIKRYYRTARI
jgi:hypothetical protein